MEDYTSVILQSFIKRQIFLLIIYNQLLSDLLFMQSLSENISGLKALLYCSNKITIFQCKEKQLKSHKYAE